MYVCSGTGTRIELSSSSVQRIYTHKARPKKSLVSTSKMERKGSDERCQGGRESVVLFLRVTNESLLPFIPSCSSCQNRDNRYFPHKRESIFSGKKGDRGTNWAIRPSLSCQPACLPLFLSKSASLRQPYVQRGSFEASLSESPLQFGCLKLCAHIMTTVVRWSCLSEGDAFDIVASPIAGASLLLLLPSFLFYSSRAKNASINL